MTRNYKYKTDEQIYNYTLNKYKKYNLGELTYEDCNYIKLKDLRQLIAYKQLKPSTNGAIVHKSKATKYELCNFLSEPKTYYNNIFGRKAIKKTSSKTQELEVVFEINNKNYNNLELPEIIVSIELYPYLKIQYGYFFCTKKNYNFTPYYEYDATSEQTKEKMVLSWLWYNDSDNERRGYFKISENLLIDIKNKVNFFLKKTNYLKFHNLTLNKKKNKITSIIYDINKIKFY